MTKPKTLEIDAGAAAVLNSYCALMEELKARVNCYNDMQNCMRANHFHIHGGFEFSQLQVRLMCEIIMLACLVAHNDIPAARTATVREIWHAEKMLKTMESMNPDFYPEPIKIGLDASGVPAEMRAAPSDLKYLTKADLKRVYTATGRYVHRGSLADIFEKKAAPSEPEFRNMQASLQEILNLLSAHRIRLKDSSAVQIWVLLGHRDEPVRAWRFLASGPGKPVWVGDQ